MSTTLAIAATTATLRNLLDKGLSGPLPGIKVTTQPPDIAEQSDAKAQLNIFLYLTAVNGAWSNMDMPRQVRPGETGAPPLALNLHYLITAYGREESGETVPDAVIGAAMSVLHDHPVLGREEIQNALEDAELHEQFERLRITSLPMGIDEMSKLWTVFQTQYRISAAYQVTVVLIDSRLPVRAALPVLKRGKHDTGAAVVGGAAPEPRAIRLPRSQAAARLGDEIAILGAQLTVNATKARFTSARALAPILLDPAAGAKVGEIALSLPNAALDMSRWSPGFYTVALVQQRDAEIAPIVSNELALAIAPRITVTLDGTIAEDPTHFTVDLTVTCAPRLAAAQQVLLLFGDRQVAATSSSNPGDTTLPTTLTFTIFGVESGDYVVRLRVDGVDSIPVAYSGTPPVPEFDPAQTVSVP